MHSCVCQFIPLMIICRILRNIQYCLEGVGNSVSLLEYRGNDAYRRTKIEQMSFAFVVDRCKCNRNVNWITLSYNCNRLSMVWLRSFIDCERCTMASLHAFAQHSHSLVAIAVNSVPWTARWRSFAEISLNICRNRTFRMVSSLLCTVEIWLVGWLSCFLAIQCEYRTIGSSCCWKLMCYLDRWMNRSLQWRKRWVWPG